MATTVRCFTFHEFCSTSWWWKSSRSTCRQSSEYLNAFSRDSSTAPDGRKPLNSSRCCIWIWNQKLMKNLCFSFAPSVLTSSASSEPSERARSGKLWLWTLLHTSRTCTRRSDEFSRGRAPSWPKRTLFHMSRTGTLKLSWKFFILLSVRTRNSHSLVGCRRRFALVGWIFHRVSLLDEILVGHIVDLLQVLLVPRVVGETVACNESNRTLRSLQQFNSIKRTANRTWPKIWRRLRLLGLATSSAWLLFAAFQTELSYIAGRRPTRDCSRLRCETWMFLLVVQSQVAGRQNFVLHADGALPLLPRSTGKESESDIPHMPHIWSTYGLNLWNFLKCGTRPNFWLNVLAQMKHS